MQSCGTKVTGGKDFHEENLCMMGGAFYDMETVKEMERHLMLKIEHLTKKLKDEKPNEFLKNEALVGRIIKSMKTKRESAHSTKPRNVPLRKPKSA